MLIVLDGRKVWRGWAIALAGLALAVALLAASAARPGELRVVSPVADAGGVRRLPVYGEVEVHAHLPLAEGTVEIKERETGQRVGGRSVVEDYRIRFVPEGIFRGGTAYEVRVRVATQGGGEALEAVFPFVTEQPEKLWVDVRLTAAPQHVVVYRGDEEVRRMITSSGRPEDPTPKGLFRLQNRGERFFSARYQQGGYYWVRFLGNYLFHSVPFDRSGAFIEEEAAKLGCPVSHGCLRLSLEDARWFYYNVPDGTLVVIRD